MGEIIQEEQMRAFISITDELLEFYSAVTQPQFIVEEVVVKEEPSMEHPLLAECRDLVFKLRATMEDSAGDYGLGVETGMQRAADMIENLIRRYDEKGDGFEQQ